MTNKGGSGFTWAYIDFLTFLCVVFLAIAVLAAPPKRKKDDADTKAIDATVTLTWDMAHDCDVDLWVQTPGDPQPVGYMRTHGMHADLIRDDLGRNMTPDSRNMEIVYVRKAPAGEYTINAVLYSNHDGKLPVPVHVVVMRPGDHTPLLDATGQLTVVRQEITLARFSLDKDGHLVPGSINHLQRLLFKSGGG